MMSMRPPQPQAITKVSISALVISLPILYVSLLRLPPYTLARDTTFWFLISNSIIAIIAADSGMLFLNSDDDDLSNSNVPGDQPAVAVQEGSFDVTSSPLMSSEEPTTVDIYDVLGGEQPRNDGIASCMHIASSTVMEEGYHHGLALIKGSEHAASKTSTDGMDHALVLQSCEEEAAAVELSTDDKNYATIVKGEEKEEKEQIACEPNKLSVEERPTLITPPLASENVGDVRDEYGYSLYETEPWRPGLVTSCKSLVEDGPHPRITPDDVPLQDKSTVAASEEKPRCSAATELEEREYWQLSDEELNWKVEEFIARFNRDMIKQEIGAGFLPSYSIRDEISDVLPT